MRFAVKNSNKDYSQVKYILVDEASNTITVILSESLDDQVKRNKIESYLKNKIDGFNVLFHQPISIEEEIKFILPQLMDELNRKFPYVNGWLSRAKISTDSNQVKIVVESNMAHKILDKPVVKSYLSNRISYYLGIKINLTLENGDFLEEIYNDIPQIYTKPENKILKQENKNNEIKSESDIVLGRKIKQDITHNIEEIKDEEKSVVVKGMVFDIEEIQTKKGTLILILSITDKRNSITAKVFLNEKKKLKGDINEGEWVILRGQVQFDRYSKELTILPKDINKVDIQKKIDMAEEKRIELHLHTKMSAMDSVVEIEKVIERAAEWGHKAIAITDHGVVQAFPEAYQAGKKYGIKIIYGLEAYLVDDGEPIIVNFPEGKINEASFTVFDLETTGLNNNRDEIIEIGAIKIEKGEIVGEFGSFIKPEGRIPAKITELTGIDDDMVKNAPGLKKVINNFLEFVNDSVLVAHNANFDYGFLRSAFKKLGIVEKDYPVLDTLALSRALFPDLKNHKLNTLANYFNVSLEHHHRAVDDARATAEILLKLNEDLFKQGVETLKDINKLTTRINWKDLPTYHAVILAKNSEGLKGLYQLVSSSHLNHFYRKPRILKSELIQYRDNLIIGSACEAGQLYRGIVENKPQKEIEKIVKFYDYLEIQPIGNNSFLVPERVNSESELMEINKRIYKLGKKFRKPVVATGDVHFLDPEDEIYRKILQAGQGYDEAEEQAPLFFRTTDEMIAEFSYLGDEKAKEVVITNPQKINDMVQELKPLPDGLFTPEIEGAEEQIKEMAYRRAHELYGDDLPDIVINRLEKELKSIIDNGFSVIYLIAHKLVKKSLDDGYLVGSRGSVGSSFVATMCEITEVNPLPPHYRCPECFSVEFVQNEEIGVGIDLPDKKCSNCGTDLIKDGYDIPFEVFMGFEGDKVPDIDLNFSGEYQSYIHQHTEELFGRDYVFRAGTISTIAKRTAFGFVKGYMDDNGLNLNQAEIKRLVKGCTGVKRTTGQHPGGLMVVPRNLDVHDFTPIQHPANDQSTTVRTTHFDYHSISGRILKLDLLGHDDPTTIRMLQDLTGVNPLEIPLDDPDTMAIFSGTESLGVSSDDIGTVVGTLGIPEFGTSFVRQMLVDTKPTTFAELIRISGLSHGTDVWLNNAQELIRDGIAQLAEVISVRDDIMNYLIQKGLEPGKAFWIMEHVRKGKGLTTEEEKYMREHGVPEWYIESCKKIKYMFPKAHAAAYVMMAFRIAYFKVHYPEAFYTTYFTIKADDFDAHMISKGYEHIIDTKKELEQKGNDLTAKEKGILTVLEIVIEAIARGIEFTHVDLYESDAFKFKMSDKGLIPPLVSLQGLGSSAAEKIAATREEKEFTSIEEMVNRTRISKTVVEIMKEHGTLDGLPEKNQLSLF